MYYSNVIPGEQDDTIELARLLQLILGCAVNCRNAQGKFIHYIRNNQFKSLYYFRLHYKY